MRRIALLPALLAVSAAAQQQRAPYVIAESGEGFARLQDAVNAIGGARGTIVIANGVHRDCAVQQAGFITFKSETPLGATFDGIACEDKAALVLRGRGAIVDGLVFQNLRVPDGNGAGIRLEQADLTVTGSIFRNSEEGILSGGDETGNVRIERSTFSGLGRCDRDLACAHGIYIGYYGSVTVTRSRFERGRGGHYLKVNAARVSITDSSFDDSGGALTNYMIDLPADAVGAISGNRFVQGRNKENHSTMIAVAAEARAHPSTGLLVTGNEAALAPGAKPTVFVANWSGEPLRIEGNQLDPGITRSEVR